MSEQVPASPGADGSTPVPRDPPDQQADEDGQDHWDAQAGQDTGGAGTGPDVPDTDEAGSGRRGEAHDTEAPSEHPEPEEPSG